MKKKVAELFASDWIAAWNSHNLDAILALYDDDFEMVSPVIVRIASEPSGKLRGKAAVGAYWRKALDASPHLKFILLGVFAGVESVVIHYHGHRGEAAEVFRIGENGKIVSSAAHYQSL